MFIMSVNQVNDLNNNGLLDVALTQIGNNFVYPHGLHFPVSFFVYISDLINLCRNISDGVRPFIPPCSLVSLYALTNISYLNFPSSMLDISSTARNSFFTILLKDM